MKNVFFNVLYILGLVVLFLLVYVTKEESPVFQKVNVVENTIENLKEENQDKELITNQDYDKFIYLEFQNDDNNINYLINSETGNEEDFSFCLKSDKEEEFWQKVSELLYLKYPKFIADVLSSNDTKKSIQIKDNEFIIYYQEVITTPQVNEELFIHINYQEVKDYLDFNYTLDSSYENENGYNYDSNKKTIAFTFDDGPNGSKTNSIVELLENNKAHATFFMVGNRMSGAETTILNVLNHGNEIGSHSYNHASMTKENINTLIANEEQTNNIYKSITGKDLIYTRPPYGSINQNIKNNLNTIFINWNVDTEDWRTRNKDSIVESIMSTVKDGDIVLMHDSYNETVSAVEEVLPLLYVNGFQVVSVSELANLNNRSLETHNLYYSLKKVE